MTNKMNILGNKFSLIATLTMIALPFESARADGESPEVELSTIVHLFKEIKNKKDEIAGMAICDLSDHTEAFYEGEVPKKLAHETFKAAIRLVQETKDSDLRRCGYEVLQRYEFRDDTVTINDRLVPFIKTRLKKRDMDVVELLRGLGSSIGALVNDTIKFLPPEDALEVLSGMKRDTPKVRQFARRYLASKRHAKEALELIYKLELNDPTTAHEFVKNLPRIGLTFDSKNVLKTLGRNAKSALPYLLAQEKLQKKSDRDELLELMVAIDPKHPSVKKRIVKALYSKDLNFLLPTLTYLGSHIFSLKPRDFDRLFALADGVDTTFNQGAAGVIAFQMNHFPELESRYLNLLDCNLETDRADSIISGLLLSQSLSKQMEQTLTALAKDSDHQLPAFKVLGDKGTSKDATKLLRKRLNDDDYVVRLIATEGLLRMGEIDILKSVLYDENSQVRETALKHIRDNLGVNANHLLPVLRKMLRDKEASSNRGMLEATIEAVTQRPMVKMPRRLKKARKLFRQAKYEESIALLSNAYYQDYLEHFRKIQLANAYAADGKLNIAIALLDEVLKEDSSMLVALYNRATYSARQYGKEPKSASMTLSYLRKLFNSMPNRRDLQRKYCSLLRKDKDFDRVKRLKWFIKSQQHFC